MKNRIVIVGVGNLGSRHLQGLSRVKQSLDIWALDPSIDALSLAESRWAEVCENYSHKIQYITCISELPPIVDIAIVATAADVRLSVVKALLKRAKISHWILEKVLAQSIGEIEELEKIFSQKISESVWVNQPMYLWPLYQKLRASCANKSPIAAKFEGFRGLACNAIHYIDFVSRWNGGMLYSVDTKKLNTNWYLSKRKGFYEIDGEISALFDDGSTLSMVSNSESLGFKAEVRLGKDIWEISERESEARSNTGEIIKGKVGYQSELTAMVIETMLSGGDLQLPSLVESAHQHRYLISALLDHWNCHGQGKSDRLPIT
jgi:predicted dehydrogenase